MDIKPRTCNLKDESPKLHAYAHEIGLDAPPFSNTWVEHWPSGRLVIWNQYKTAEVTGFEE
jgi:hypothetical protein